MPNRKNIQSMKVNALGKEYDEHHDSNLEEIFENDISDRSEGTPLCRNGNYQVMEVNEDSNKNEGHSSRVNVQDMTIGTIDKDLINSNDTSPNDVEDSDEKTPCSSSWPSDNLASDGKESRPCHVQMRWKKSCRHRKSKVHRKKKVLAQLDEEDKTNDSMRITPNGKGTSSNHCTSANSSLVFQKCGPAIKSLWERIQSFSIGSAAAFFAVVLLAMATSLLVITVLRKC